MTDERPAAQEAIWQQLRSIEPPAGARERVREQIDHRLTRKSRWIWLAVPAAAVAAVIAVVLVLRRDVSSGAGPTVLAASSATQSDRALAAGDQLDDGAVTVEGSLRVAIDRAAVEVVGPATVTLTRDGVELAAGKLEIAGSADVRGPTCSARVAGKSTVEVRDKSRLVVTVFAGSAEILAPKVDCEVFDLSTTKVAQDAPKPVAPAKPAGEASAIVEPPAPLAPTPVTKPAPATPGPIDATTRKPGAIDDTARKPSPDALAARTRDTRPAANRPPTTDSSDLAAQTDAYWAAHALRERDPAATLAKLRALVQQWPRAAIRHEVDLAIIDALVRLQRGAEARTAAKQFVRDYPSSARLKDMRAIADAP